MKKVNFKNCFRAFLATFCLLFLGVVGANAQQGPDAIGGAGANAGTTLYDLPQGSFQGNQAAMNTLSVELTNLKGMLLQIPNGADPVYIALMRQITYYIAVNQELFNGSEVPQSIVTGLGVFNDTSGLTEAELLALKNLAIELLN